MVINIEQPDGTTLVWTTATDEQEIEVYSFITGLLGQPDVVYP